MRILVTGANGFVGTHLVNKLKKDNTVVSLVHNNIRGAWQREALDGTVIVNTDIRSLLDLKRIIARYQIDQVYHLASLAIVKTAHSDPFSTFDINTMGTVAVLEACRTLDVERVLVMCTDKVYGSVLRAHEDFNYPKSNEPYAASKICQAIVVGSYIHTYDMDVVMAHSCNIFGYDPFSNRIVPNVVKRCLRGQNPRIFTNDTSIREYVYVGDVVDALISMMRLTGRGSYNIVSGSILNQEQVVRKILDLFPYLEEEYMKGDLPNQIAEQSLSTIRWDWRPSWSFHDAIETTIALFKTYSEDWI
jgi:nucleoside-diphosphate-sugar epimerase